MCVERESEWDSALCVDIACCLIFICYRCMAFCFYFCYSCYYVFYFTDSVLLYVYYFIFKNCILSCIDHTLINHNIYKFVYVYMYYPE